MISNITLIKLFEEMMVSEKISSANTRRAYVCDIKTFIGFLKSENEMSVLSIEKKHLTAWLSKLNDDNISINQDENNNIVKTKILNSFPLVSCQLAFKDFIAVKFLSTIK